MLSIQEITKYLQELDNWSLEGSTIQKVFEFDNFKEAMIFVNKVSSIANEHNHHPDITIKYNKVLLSLTTHSAKGLTEKDFVLAKSIDNLQ